jgi:hypothetical protein
MKTSHGKCHSDSNLCCYIDDEVVAMAIFPGRGSGNGYFSWARLWELTCGRGDNGN